MHKRLGHDAWVSGMDNDVLTFTEEVSKAICWREAAYLLPDGNPNPVLGVAGSGEDSVGKVLEGEVGVWSHRDPRHLVKKVSLQELERGGAATGAGTAMQLVGNQFSEPTHNMNRERRGAHMDGSTQVLRKAYFPKIRPEGTDGWKYTQVLKH